MKTFNKLMASILSVSMLLSSAGFVSAADENTPTTETLAYVEDLTQYNATNSAYGSENKVVDFRVKNPWTNPTRDQTFAENSTGEWQLSGKFNGPNQVEEVFASYAFVTSDSLSLYNRDNNGGGATANFDLKGKDVVTLTSANMRGFGKGNGLALRFLMSEDEETYYELGWDYSKNQRTTTSRNTKVLDSANGGPYFVEVIDGVVTHQASAVVGTNEEIAAGKANWSSNLNTFMPTNYSITIDNETGAITYSMIMRDGAGSGDFTGTYTSSNLAAITAAAKYPVGIGSVGGNGLSEVREFAFNAVVEDEVKEPSPYTYYTEFNDVTDGGDNDYVIPLATNDETGYSYYDEYGAKVEANAPKKIVTSKGADYILSGIQVGYLGLDTKPGAAFIDAYKYLYLKDIWSAGTRVNTDLGDKTYSEISKIYVKTTAGGHGHGIQFLMNEAENSFYSLITSHGYNEWGYSNGIPQAPVLLYNNSGKATVLAQGTYAAGASSGGNNEYIINITGNTISYEIISNGVSTFKGEYTADNLAKQIKNTKYPVSMIKLGDSSVGITKVGISYVAEDNIPPTIDEDFSKYDATNSINSGSFTSKADEWGSAAWTYPVTVPGWRMSRGKTDITKTQTQNDVYYKWVTSGKDFWNAKGSSRDKSYSTISSSGALNVVGSGENFGGLTYFEAENLKNISKISWTARADRSTAMVLFVDDTEEKFIGFQNATSNNFIKSRTPGVFVFDGTRENTNPAPVWKVKPNVAAEPDGTEPTIETVSGYQEVTDANYTDNVSTSPSSDFNTAVKWTVKFRDDGGIDWMAEGLNDAVASGKISAAEVNKYKANAKHLFGFMSMGDNVATIDNVRIWGEADTSYIAPLYYDDFSYYTDDATDMEYDNVTSQTTTVSNKLEWKNLDTGEETTKDYTGIYTADGAQGVSTGKRTVFDSVAGAKWVTSAKHNGSYAGKTQADETTLNYPGFAYIDTVNNNLRAKGTAAVTSFTAINLDFGADKRVENLTRAEFTLGKPPRNAGVRLFVSGDEKTFVEFGLTGEEESLYKGGTETPNYKRHPYIIKVVNGIRSLIYTGDMYAVDYVYEDGAASTIKTTSTWTPEVVPSTTLTVDYDVWVEGGKLCWKVTSSHGASSYGEIGDADVLAMMDKNWVYPVAFSAGGDGNGSTLNEIAIWADVRDFDAATEYEKKAYSKKEIYDLYTDALYGREEDAQALLELDLSDVTGNVAEATFTVENTKIGINGSMTGVHQEYYDCYSYFYDENGNLRDDYKIWAHGQEPISSVRFGGASSLQSNMWADLNKKPTYYVSLPSDMLADAEQESKLDEAERTKPYIGKKLRDAYKMGLAEQIAAFKENNPKMSFTLCVSPFTTTADDLRNLVTALTKTGVEVNGQTVESLRQEWFGSTAPINIYAIELGNEVEWQIETNEDFEARAAWYQDYAMKMMDVMDEVDPSGKIKVMICGTTAPWGNDGTNGVITNRWKRWLTHLMTDLELSGDGTYVPAATGGQSLVERADIVTYHPYYYGHISEYLIRFADLWYNGDEDFAGLKSENPNIKLSYSEHGVNWEGRRLDTTNLYSALSNSYFIQIASECPYSDSAYQHSMVGNDLWSRWQYQDGQFVENPLGTTFNLMTDTYGNNVYNSTFEITTDQEDAYFADSDAATTTSTRFIATAFEVSDDTINLVFTNNQGYTPVNTTINLPQELADYKLVKTAVMTAPNMYSHTFNLATDKIAKINTVELDTPEAVPATYTVPAKSIVVLTISTNTSKKLKDEFNYAAGNPVSSNVDSETFETTPNTIVTASNGTKWITASSWAQAAYGDEGDMGTAQLDGSRLVVNNRSDSPYPMIANWDISEYSAIDELESMTSITFKTTNTNANGGVKLFVTPVYDADSATYIHTSNYYFSNELAGMDGTIDWTVILDKANGKLYWTADGIDSNNGVMSITSDDLTDYTYFAQLFVEDNYGTSGSVALDEISVIYGGTETPDMPKQFITIGEAAENKIPVTVEPSVKPAGVTTFTVIAAYYTGTKLDKVVTTDFTADATAQDTINLDTAASGQTIKLMVWDSASGMKPINGSALSVQ